MPVPLREVVFRNTNNIEVTLTVEAPIGSVVGAPQTVAPMSNVTVRPGVTDCLSVRLTASDPTPGPTSQTFAVAPPIDGRRAFLDTVQAVYAIADFKGKVTARTDGID